MVWQILGYCENKTRDENFITIKAKNIRSTIKNEEKSCALSRLREATFLIIPKLKVLNLSPKCDGWSVIMCLLSSDFSNAKLSILKHALWPFNLTWKRLQVWPKYNWVFSVITHVTQITPSNIEYIITLTFQIEIKLKFKAIVVSYVRR